MWIGVSANENCDFRKSNGYPLNYEGWSGDEPKCTSGQEFSIMFPEFIDLDLVWIVRYVDSC